MLTQVETENGLIPVMIALGLLNFGVAPTIAHFSCRRKHEG